MWYVKLHDKMEEDIQEKLCYTFEEVWIELSIISNYN